jgi:eukaryotic-like serine/threonine-protein kinase
MTRGTRPPVSAPSSSLTFAAGQIVGDRFRIVRFIASGGMGELYEAEDLELHEHVALKTVRPDIAQDAIVIARFKRGRSWRGG